MTIQAGYGEQIITPPLGVDLTGYGYYLDRKAESVLDDLKTRAIFLHRDGTTLLLISCDLVGFSVRHSDQIRSELSQEFNLPFESILLSCTHTHTGPATLELRALGEIDADYLASLPGKIKKAVKQAIAEAVDAEFHHHREALEPIGYNRRQRSFSPIDPVLKIGLLSRATRDIYFLGYSCHPVALGRLSSVSADWPGAVIREMENRGHHAVFFQGFLDSIRIV